MDGGGGEEKGENSCNGGSVCEGLNPLLRNKN